MGKTRYIISYIVILVVAISVLGPAYAKGPKGIYLSGVKATRSGNSNFALFDFRQIIKEFPNSKFAEPALFMIGENYFAMSNYYDANKAFQKHIELYPDSKRKLFSLVYLLKLARIYKKESLIKDLEKEIISFYQLSFLFRDFKTYEHKSPSYKKYKAVYYIDKVEFYIDGEQFEKIPF